MEKSGSKGFKGFRAELRLHAGLLRLVELRLEEVERKISFIEARAREVRR